MKCKNCDCNLIATTYSWFHEIRRPGISLECKAHFCKDASPKLKIDCKHLEPYSNELYDQFESPISKELIRFCPFCGEKIK